MNPLKNILVAVDFGESSKEALDLAVELAKRFDAKLTITHTCEIPAYAYPGVALTPVDLLGPIEDAARQALQGTLSDVQKRIPGARGILRRGTAAAETLAAIEETKPDLVVIGTHGRTGLSHLLLGSVAEKLVRLSPVPVLTVPHHAGRTPEHPR